LLCCYIVVGVVVGVGVGVVVGVGVGVGIGVFVVVVVVVVVVLFFSLDSPGRTIMVDRAAKRLLGSGTGGESLLNVLGPCRSSTNLGFLDMAQCFEFGLHNGGYLSLL
jgi:hypothetical protein